MAGTKKQIKSQLKPYGSSALKELTKAEKKAKAENVLRLFSNGEWNLGREILEINHQETWLYEVLLNGAKIEKGEILPSALVKKYFTNLTDVFGNSLNNSDMVILGVLAEAPKCVLKMCKLDLKKINLVSCIPGQASLEYFAHIHDRFPSIKNWRIFPRNDLFEINNMSDSEAKLLSQWWDMEVVGFDNLSKISDKAIAYLCSPCPQYLGLCGLKTLSGNAAKSIADLLKRGASGIDLSGLETISEEAVKTIIKSGEIYISGNHVEGFFVPKKIQAIITKQLEKTLSSVGKTEYLCKQSRVLFLDGLTSLRDAAAQTLSNHKGDLELNGLTNLSKVAAKALSNIKGELRLPGLKHLSIAGAKALANKKGGEIRWHEKFQKQVDKYRKKR